MDEYEDYQLEMAQADEDEIRMYQQKMDTVNTYIQEITNYLGPDSSEKEKRLQIRFPYGYIGTANNYRNLINCVKDIDTESNIAYTLIMSDLNRWLINRTDIRGTLQEMIIKHEIVLMASICETLTVLHAGKKKNYNQRIENLYEKKIIDIELKKDLIWLWDKRVGIHLFELAEKEYQKYDIEDFSKSREIAKRFLIVLNK